jgi:hypothetical protein
MTIESRVCNDCDAQELHSRDASIEAELIDVELIEPRSAIA